MKIFIAGIMQGSKIGLELHSQDYRKQLKSALTRAFPNSTIYDPFESNRNSLYYTPEMGKKVFLTHNRMCGTEIDVLIAFVPEASMGTSIEIWEAWKNGAVVLTISPLSSNWAVKFLSDAIYPNLESFLQQLGSGEISRLIEQRRPRSTKRSLENLESLGIESN
jgi:hypothetical protein